MEIKHYTKDRIPDVLQFERDLRAEENFWGWEIDDAEASGEAVVIPARFDSVYEDYNAIQQGQGLDLMRYRGKTVMRYTYPVRNYAGYDGTVYATLLIYKDRVIGGDICSASADGFVHGWEAP